MKPSKRRHRRVPFSTKVKLAFHGGDTFKGKSADISISGMMITDIKLDLYKHVGEACQLRFKVPVGDVEYELGMPAQLVRASAEGVALQFLDLKAEDYELLSRLVESSMETRGKVLADLKQSGGLEVHQVITKILRDELAERITGVVNETFIAFTDLKITAGPAIEKPDYEDYKPPEAEWTAVVNYAGGLRGGLHLAAPLHVGIGIASAFGGEHYGHLDNYTEEAMDAFCEMANIIAGGLQDSLSAEVDGMELTPPHLIIGNGYTTRYQKRLSSIKQYFVSPKGPFLVEVFFEM